MRIIKHSFDGIALTYDSLVISKKRYSLEIDSVSA